jgi:hypothetical protein
MLMQVIAVIYLCYLIGRVVLILRHDTKLPVLSASTGNDTIYLINGREATYSTLDHMMYHFKGPISM